MSNKQLINNKMYYIKLNNKLKTINLIIIKIKSNNKNYF